MGSSDALHAGVVVEASADRMLAVEEVAAYGPDDDLCWSSGGGKLPRWLPSC
jgi:hypothetical protein